MSVVSGFSNDCFVSYSHIDNIPFGDPWHEGWVDIFHALLENFINVHLGQRIKVWRDRRLTGAEVFSDEIEQQLRSSAVLISIISPGYLRSVWCNRELSGFVQTATEAGNLRVGNLQRVVKVLRLPVDAQLLPEFLDDMLGTPFYRVDPASNRARDLLLDPGAEAMRTYRARVDDVAHDVKRVLGAMADIGVAPVAPATMATRQRVFLAWTASELHEERERLRRELEARGFHVLPQGDPPLMAERLAMAVGQALHGAALAIHLIGSHYGFVPEDENRSVVELQGDAAQALVDQGVPCIFWQAPGATTMDARLTAMIARVQARVRPGATVDLLAGQTAEKLKTLVLDRLVPAPQVTPRPAAGPRKMVYLVCDRLDRDDVRPLRKHLFDAALEVRLPLFEGDAEELRLEHEQLLKECAGVLIYWGHAREAWLRKHLRDLKHIFGVAPDPRRSAFAALSLYVAGPGDPDKEAFMTHELPVLAAGAGFDPTLLQPFLAALSTA